MYNFFLFLSNSLQKVPSVISSYISKKHYLHAAKELTSAIALGDGPLREVDGLHELRIDLDLRKNQLYSKLIEELSKHLYQSSTLDALSSFNRQSSGRGSSNYASPFQRNMMRRSAERIEANTKVKRALFEMAQGFDIEKSEIIENADLLDPELNSTYFIGIIIECFALLNKVPESLETIKVQIQNELLTIVTKTTQYILGLDIQTSDVDPLLELFELLFKQFKLIAVAHSMALKNYLSVMQRYEISAKLYELSEFWAQAQGVLQLALTDYLDIQNATEDDLPRQSFTEQNSNINSYFNRRKTQNKKTLFKFEKSSNTSENENKEHRRNASDMSNDENLVLSANLGNEQKKRRERILVCTPDPNHIRKCYIPLMGYIQEIQIFMKSKSGQPCTLNAFLSTHIKEAFLARGHNRSLQLTIDSLTKSADAWRVIISPEEMKTLGLARPLLQSTVLVENKITETRNLIQDLPDYSEELLKTVCSLLKAYRESCQVAYRGIVQPETEDKRIFSVAWLKDEDISRFLKTLPNWTDLKTSKLRAKQQFTTGSANKRATLKAGGFEPSEEESPIQIQQRNIREAEMLTSNLGESGISYQEILSDIGVLKELAILQESMEWFSSRISEFANDLRKPIMNGMVNSNNEVTIKDGTIKVLTNLALEFDELANTCLLVLHLEVRVQFFHYLRTNLLDKKKDNKSDSLEPDLKVMKLTKVLTDMDEALNSTLHPRKTKVKVINYLF